MNRRSALIFIDADVVVRHFLDSAAFSRLAETHDITLVFPPKDWNRLVNSSCIDRWGFPAIRIEIPQYRRTLFGKLFYIDQARLRFDREWREIRAGWFAMVGWKAALLFSMLALPGIRQLATAVIRRRLSQVPAEALKKLFDMRRPDILIHPSIFQGYFINDLLLASAERAIPFLLLMNSWDNPSLKRAALGSPDAVTVWGEQTARHARKFMAIPADRIHVLGAAQFQVFQQEPTKSRDAICKSHGIDPRKRIILYAGSSKGNRESLHLRWLNDAIASGRFGNAVVLYRPHPYGIDVSEARAIMNDTLPHVVIEYAMRELLEAIINGCHRGFFSTPYEDTHALLSAIDVLISPLSTILIEAGLHGKPALCFIPQEEDVGSIWATLRRVVYFRELMHSRGLLLARSYEEFLPAVEKSFDWLDDPQQAQRIREEMKFFVEFPPTDYANALAKLANSLEVSVRFR